jgi:polysaccharide pyruvyl transferase WcaK-like protein
MQVVYNSARKTRSTAPFHVLLYTLIPEDRAYRPIHRNPFVFVRNRVRRWAELLSWRVLGRWRAHYSTFKDRENTNRGDIAIRMGVKSHVEQAFAGQAITITDLAWGDLDIALKMSPAPDLVVIAGGGFLFADNEGRLPPRFAKDVAAIESLACPVVACAIGLNWLIEGGGDAPFRFHPDSLDDIQRFLSRLNLASVRDENTQRALAAVDRRSLRVIVDPAFVVTPAPAPARSPKGNQTLEIGLNVAFHAIQTSITSHRMMPLLLEVCRRLERERPCRFTYFVHSDGEEGIAHALKLAGLKLEVVHDDVDLMLAAYRRMDIHIGQMLHSAILAMSVGTPALSLAYDVKSAGFYNLLGLGELCLDASVTTVDEVLASVRALIESRDAVSAALLVRRAELESESQDFYAEVAALVSPYRTGRLAPLHATPTNAQSKDARSLSRK